MSKLSKVKEVAAKGKGLPDSGARYLLFYLEQELLLKSLLEKCLYKTPGEHRGVSQTVTAIQNQLESFDNGEISQDEYVKRRDNLLSSLKFI